MKIVITVRTVMNAPLVKAALTAPIVMNARVVNGVMIAMDVDIVKDVKTV